MVENLKQSMEGKAQESPEDRLRRIAAEIDDIVADHEGAIESGKSGAETEARQKYGRPSLEEEHSLQLVNTWVPALKELAVRKDLNSGLVEMIKEKAQIAAGALEKLGLVGRLDSENRSWLEGFVARKLEDQRK